MNRVGGAGVSRAGSLGAGVFELVEGGAGDRQILDIAEREIGYVVGMLKNNRDHLLWNATMVFREDKQKEIYESARSLHLRLSAIQYLAHFYGLHSLMRTCDEACALSDDNKRRIGIA